MRFWRSQHLLEGGTRRWCLDFRLNAFCCDSTTKRRDKQLKCRCRKRRKSGLSMPTTITWVSHLSPDAVLSRPATHEAASTLHAGIFTRTRFQFPRRQPTVCFRLSSFHRVLWPTILLRSMLDKKYGESSLSPFKRVRRELGRFIDLCWPVESAFLFSAGQRPKRHWRGTRWPVKALSHRVCVTPCVDVRIGIMSACTRLIFRWILISWCL